MEVDQQHNNAKSLEKVLITGAPGFIGSHVTAYFCRNNTSVKCYVRENSNLQYIEKLPVEFFKGNLNEPEKLNEACRNTDCVIHIAAFAKDWGKYKDFYNTNVSGTLNVLKVCKDNGVKHIILTGSVSSYGEENSIQVKSEESPYNSHYSYFLDSVFPCKMNYYRDTKAISTKEAIKYAEENRLNVTILEPVWVYGEKEFGTGFYDYMKTVTGKVSHLPGSKKNRFHVIYAEDLARAYYLAYKKKLKGIHRIIIGNRERAKMDTLYSLFCKELGIKKPKNLSKVVSYPAGFLLELIYTLSASKKPPLLTRGRVNMFYDNIEYSVKKAEDLLSFKNKYSLEEGIKRTVNWYKERNLI